MRDRSLAAVGGEDGLPAASDHVSRLRDELYVRTVYADLDGTLLGPGGSLFAHPGGTTGEPALALVALADAGIDLVLVSGRTGGQMREVARALGASAYVAELGGLLVHRQRHSETVVENLGAFDGPGTPYEAIARSGACGLLLDRYRGRLEPHDPWAFVPRRISMLLRGNVDPGHAQAFLAGAGFGWLDLRDNGVISPNGARFPRLHLGDDEEVRAYHLVPTGVSKRSGVALHRERVGLPREACIAVGDSASDLELAGEVGALFVVANGSAAVRGLAAPPNAYLTERSHGLGFVDAVLPFADRA
jgi:hydroxymethylpyrimidine pyrophosphatase-like HAD family hydrolase